MCEEVREREREREVNKKEPRERKRKKRNKEKAREIKQGVRKGKVEETRTKKERNGHCFKKNAHLQF